MNLENILIDRYEMQNTRKQNEYVKNRMNVRNVFLFPEQIDHGADGIKNTAEKDQPHSGSTDGKDTVFQTDQDAPPHRKIRDHGKNAEFVHIDSSQSNGKQSRTPDNAENDPSPNGRYNSEGNQNDGRVGSGDQKIDRTMIDNAEHFFRFYGNQTVINTGHCEKQNDGEAVNQRAYDPPGIAVDNGFDHAQNQSQYPTAAPDDVGGHITNFFCPRIRR